MQSGYKRTTHAVQQALNHAGDVLPPEEQEQRVLSAVKLANTAHYCPKDDVVAVKVQYGDALDVFMKDLQNLRCLAGILSKSEIQFDLVSAVDELNGQVKLEFDFRRYVDVEPDCDCFFLLPGKILIVHRDVHHSDSAPHST